jgi:hypothetical protein
LHLRFIGQGKAGGHTQCEGDQGGLDNAVFHRVFPKIAAGAYAAGDMKPMVLAERVGFEPTVRINRTPDFESGAFDHSATSPGMYRLVVRSGKF